MKDNMPHAKGRQLPSRTFSFTREFHSLDGTGSTINVFGKSALLYIRPDIWLHRRKGGLSAAFIITRCS
jgi:hypothetical protein